MATEEYTVVWNGSRTGPGRGLLLDYELPRERERRTGEKRPTLDVSPAAVGAGRHEAVDLLPEAGRGEGNAAGDGWLPLAARQRNDGGAARTFQIHAVALKV